MSSSEESRDLHFADPEVYPEGTKVYVLEKSSRSAKCRGPKKACAFGNQCDKQQVRFGTRGAIDGNPSTFWRHVECCTAKMFKDRGLNASNIEDYVEVRQGKKEALMISDEEKKRAFDKISVISNQEITSPSKGKKNKSGEGGEGGGGKRAKTN